MSSIDHLQELSSFAEAEFRLRFGRPPRWLVASPGRVNLIGEHTDYNDGFVLPMAIDRHVVIAADRPDAASTQARVYSEAFREWTTLAVVGPPWPDVPGWAAYVQGVIAGCVAANLHSGPFEAVIHADLPVGSGLASSAALEVAVATLLESLMGVKLEPLEKARLCQRAEHAFAGVPCGIMDQCASVMALAGTALLLDCRSLEVRWTPLADPEVLTLIMNTNVKHTLITSEYAERRRQCAQAARLMGVASLRDVNVDELERARARLDDVLYRRARHVITENERTVTAADAIARGDWTRVGQLMAASHASLRDDYEVSCPELNLLVELAEALGPAHGVLGSRMTGGGFGGCTVSFVRQANAAAVSQILGDRYQRKAGRPATAFTTLPAQGARELKAPAP